MNSIIGSVILVTPSKIQVEIIDKEDISYNEEGYSYFYDGINSFISIQGVNEVIQIYQVNSMFERDLSTNLEAPFFNENKYIFEAEPLGEIINNTFSFGINNYPLLGDHVSLSSESDLKKIIDSKKNSISIGKIIQKNIYPKIGIDGLFSNHCCVLGNTGSGKSTTVKTILRSVLDKVKDNEFDSSKINLVVFDIHNEYFIDEDNAYIENIDILEDVSIELSQMEKEDWINLVDPSNQTQLPVLLKSLKFANLMTEDSEFSWIKAYAALELFNNVQTDANAKKVKVQSLLNSLGDENLTRAAQMFNDFGGVADKNRSEFEGIIKKYVREKSKINYEEVKIHVDTYLSKATYKISNLIDLEASLEIVFLLEEMKGNSQIRSYCSTLLTRIETLRYNYANNLFSEDHKKKLRFNSIFDNDNSVTVLNVSKFDNLDLKFISSYLLTYIMDKQKQIDIGSREIFNIILDEAHRYMNDQSNNGLPIVYDRVAKEGRKYGVFFFIASQRPSELSSTVLSQCNNYFLHRIRNNVDLDFIRKSIPFITDNSLKRISYLPTGVSLCLGDSFSVPFELKIHMNKEEPLTKVSNPSDLWVRKI